MLSWSPCVSNMDMLSAVTASQLPGDDMTDEQMQDILVRASTRLRQKEEMQKAQQTEQFTLPRLSTGEIARPYVSTKKGVAHMNGQQQVSEQQRKLSNQVRKVEDPVVVQQRLTEVCSTDLIYEGNLPRRKTYPKHILEQSLAPSWLSFCATESFIIIVTLRPFETSHSPPVVCTRSSH